jgi:epoxyqueuosine reductase QueG
MTRAKHTGFLRNVAVAMGNSGNAGGEREQFREPLERLAEHADAMVAEHARWALAQLDHKMEKTVGQLSELEAV